MSVATTIAAINATLGSVNAMIPLAAFAISELWKLFKKDNPQATEENFIAYLRSEGREVKNFSASWLTAHGYAQVNGEWVKQG